MHVTSFILNAILATTALAAPTPKTPSKRSFKAVTKARPRLPPRNAMAQVFRKYWQIIVINPDEVFGGLFGGDDDSPFGGFGGESYGNGGYGYPTSSAVAAPTGVPSGYPGPSGVVPSSAPFPVPNATFTGTGSYPTATGAPVGTSVAAPTSTASPPSGSGEGEVTATPEDNEVEYLSPVTIGGQKLNLDFDTGSSDLWVYSSSLPASDQSGHSVFDPSKSSTWQEYQGGSWAIHYGDGSTASGTVGFDVVDVGGATATKQAVELATTIADQFKKDPNSDGLLGLGFSSINQVEPKPQKTFFDSVLDTLDQPLFTADLEDNASGTYEFGTIDHSKYSGELHYVDIDNSQGFWQFSSPSYTVAGKKSQCTTCNPAIADTGTSLMIVDDDIAKAYYANVPGVKLNVDTAGYTYPCGTKLSDFGVGIGEGYTATIPGSAMNYAEVTAGRCFGGLQSASSQLGADAPKIQIYGDHFLKNFFVVFNAGETKLGVAAKA